MSYEPSEKVKKLQKEVSEFMDAYVYPNEAKYHEQIENADNRWAPTQIMEELKAGGAEAVILGCTEIALLVAQADTEIPLYDTTAIHARRAVELALG